ncbi:MAG: hypothetical protein R6W72_06180 [Desulfurivibrionaceae bacterium]
MKSTETDRVRAHTSGEINRQIDQETDVRVRKYSQLSPDDITRRIEALDREWDMERTLETNASVFGFTGLVLGLTHSKKWLMVPGLVLSFLFQHAVQGWCPPVPVFRRLGVRTRREIDREKYALKVLRGDLDIKKALPRAESALKSVDA